jgi:hypothetical protein
MRRSREPFSIFSVSSSKARGPDGFLVEFFHKAWFVVGRNFMDAIKSFFQSGKLLRESNATILTLVPQIPNPSIMGDFRPIACRNFVYKCIRKILANRLLSGLDAIISNNQAAFVPHRSILENVLFGSRAGM